MTPLPHAYCHGGCVDGRPVHDALAQGFTSIEVDVRLVDGQLLAAHDECDIEPTRTLQELYLEPLRAAAEQGGGAVHPGYAEPFQLVVDVKTEARDTYLALDEMLRRYPSTVTRWRDERVEQGPVDVVVSGHRAVDVMAAQPVRHAAYDGRPGELGCGAPPTLMPMVSGNWREEFGWTGTGPMSPDERDKLRSLAARADALGHRLRFWKTPDHPSPEREAVWSAQLDAGVHYLTTDDLAGLRTFLLSRRDGVPVRKLPAPAPPQAVSPVGAQQPASS